MVENWLNCFVDIFSQKSLIFYIFILKQKYKKSDKNKQGSKSSFHKNLWEVCKMIEN
jgi:hypothetical protein